MLIAYFPIQANSLWRLALKAIETIRWIYYVGNSIVVSNVVHEHKREDTVNVTETLNLAILQGSQSCYIHC